MAALNEVIAAMDAEWERLGHEQSQSSSNAAAAQEPPPAPAPAPAPPEATVAEADLERRLRALRGGDGERGASATRLLVTSPLMDDDDANLQTDAGGGAATLPEPSAPPPLDDGPAAVVDMEKSGVNVNNPAAVIDFDTAFKALRVSEEGAAGVKYYPALPSSPAAAPQPKQQQQQQQQPAGGGRFSGRGQLRPLVLASGLIGKFLEIAEPNSRKVRACVVGQDRTGQAWMPSTSVGSTVPPPLASITSPTPSINQSD